jgi:hypothetical protein
MKRLDQHVVSLSVTQKTNQSTSDLRNATQVSTRPILLCNPYVAEVPIARSTARAPLTHRQPLSPRRKNFTDAV